MSKTVNFFIIIIIGILVSCEDVIEVTLPENDQKLIVDAIIRIDTNEELIPFEVKVSTTNSFFEKIPVTSLEYIVILVITLDEFGFEQTAVKTLAEVEEGSGIYVPDPCCEINLTYSSVLESNPIFRMIIDHQGKRYYAETPYVSTVPIDQLAIGDGTLFGEDESTELIVTFTDENNKENFYFFDFGFNEFLISDDRFYSGQEFEFSYFYDQSFKSGTQLDVSIMGVDKPFADYMEQLIEQSEPAQGPFQTPVSTVRGNVFDITGLDNIDIFDNVERPNDFALGYFAVVQELKKSIILE